MKEHKVHITRLLENVCRQDDQKSFEELFKLLYQRLINFCMHYVKEKESAEEIVLDIFTKMWLKRKDLMTIRNIETYLFVAVKNQSLNHIKQFSHFQVVYLAENGIHQLSNGENPATKLEQKELFAQMDLAIKSLPPQCRTIFHLVKEQKLKYKEVSKILNLSPRTVETQLVRAMKKLDAIIFPHLTSYRKRSIKNGNKILSIIKSIFF